MLRQVVDLFACWKGLFGTSYSVDVWKIVPHALCGVFGGKEMIEV
jgi:hypothetical protein